MSRQVLTTDETVGQPEAAAEVTEERRSWWLGFTSLAFIILQSACTAVIAFSGVRVIIGLSSLAAAAGLHQAATGFHTNAIRIPMMLLAVAGSVINLYVVWRIRSLRGRSSSQWRARPVTPKQNRSELFQIAMSVMTLALVVAEWLTHHIVHNI